MHVCTLCAGPGDNLHLLLRIFLLNELSDHVSHDVVDVCNTFHSVSLSVLFFSRSSLTCDESLVRPNHRSIYKYLDGGLLSLTIDTIRAPQTHLS